MTANISNDNTFTLKLVCEAQKLNLCAMAILPATTVRQAPPVNLKEIPPGLSYLERNLEIRTEPDLIHPGCKNVICVAIAYPLLKPDDDNGQAGIISSYAQGRDYHKVLKKKLGILGRFIQTKIPNLTFRAIADSAPFPEQYLAELCGMATGGHNGLLAVSNAGSAIFLGELLLNTDIIPLLSNDTDNTFASDSQSINSHATNGICLLPQNPQKLICPSSCHACKKACPTSALTSSGFLASRCISYLTIESNEEIPFELWSKLGTRIFGCDSCQLCCPRCRGKAPVIDADFASRFNSGALNFFQLLKLNHESFTNLFAGTPIMHAGYRRFMRNVFTACSNATPSMELAEAVLKRIDEFPEYSRTINHSAEIISSAAKQ